MKIAHLTSVHPRYDTRIFLKMCRSLAAAGHEVTLVVADGKGDETRDGVEIVDVGASRGRLDRALGATRRVLRRAIAADAEFYHLHDPELLLAGLALKRRGKHVIFDSHEDIPQDILTKPYIPKPARRPISIAARVGLHAIGQRLDGLIAATPFIRDTYRSLDVPVIDINNYPILDELADIDGWATKELQVCYIGSMTIIRGLLEMIQAMALVKSNATLNLGGKIEGTDIDGLAQLQTGWDRVNTLGFLDRNGARDVFARSMAGIVTFLPGPNHLEAQPNKMFEYMAAGIPVIASDFPLWRRIIEGNKCGLLVDPKDPRSIAGAIDALISDPRLARELGENGRRAVKAHYSWQPEAEKLVSFYERILA